MISYTRNIRREYIQRWIYVCTIFTYRRCLVTVLLLTEVLDWTQLFPWAEECNFPRYTFGYADRNGPHMWKLLYPDSNGGNQSPINVTTQLAVVVQPSEPLRWSGYDKGPLSMTITNNENNGAIFHHRFNKQNYLFRSAPTNYSIAARNIFLYVFFFFFFHIPIHSKLGCSFIRPFYNTSLCIDLQWYWTRCGATRLDRTSKVDVWPTFTTSAPWSFTGATRTRKVASILSIMFDFLWSYKCGT